MSTVHDPENLVLPILTGLLPATRSAAIRQTPPGPVGGELHRPLPKRPYTQISNRKNRDT
ncbi:MAG: hypothetical protein JRJ42_01025 [Deltaproteobacteria bacterium]|nr:hypothetical protein [Deltaproteobacteria bacterium]MBW2018964.1 hypothetical protein [Deltaproteobacteria bacterium]MBW2073554.1 hypothetical protein [Deltaproteobacteria bacterium]